MRMPEKSIPWEAVDLIETDPARRVRLRLAYDRLSRLHPADIADILEELAPAEREAVFGLLNEEVAAEALEEIDPKMQIELMRSIDSDKAADIVEEMDPDAAADLLGDLPQETSEEILEEMEPEERQEVSELLAFHENTAAGRMTTDYIALSPEHTVGDAIDRLRSFEGPVETLSTFIWLTRRKNRRLDSSGLAGSGAGRHAPAALTPEHVIYCEVSASDKDVAEMFDKYNSDPARSRRRTTPRGDHHRGRCDQLLRDRIRLVGRRATKSSAVLCCPRQSAVPIVEEESQVLCNLPKYSLTLMDCCVRQGPQGMPLWAFSVPPW